MTWENGYREQKTYDSTDQSFEDFKRIWEKYYERYPDRQLAIKWTGNDRAETWLKNVNYYYEKN